MGPVLTRIATSSATAFVIALWGAGAAAQDPAPVVPAADPAPSAAVKPRADLQAANELVKAGSYEEAAKLLEQKVVEHPDDPAALLMYGEVLLVLGRAADARPHLEKCAALDPERKRVHFQLATALEGTGAGEQALAHYAREIEINDDPQVQLLARLNRSVLLQGAKRWSEAATELEAALALEPEDLRIHGELAGLYLQAGELDRAAAALERGVEDGYSSPEHFYILGSRYYQDKAYEKAVGALTQAVTLNTGHADAERRLGAALDQLGRSAEAVQHFKRYLELRPDAPEAAELKKRIAGAKGS